MPACSDDDLHDTVQDICEVLSSDEFTEDISSVEKVLEDIIKYNEDMALNPENQRLSDKLGVLTSEQDFYGPCEKLPLTSSPLLPEQNNSPEKHSCEERAYIKNIADIVKQWLNTTDPKISTIEESFFKETIANDIAVQVKDFAKHSQIQENMMYYNEDELLSDVYKDDNKERRNILPRVVAQKIQEHLENKTSESEIRADLKSWLNQVIDPLQTKGIDGLTEHLKDKKYKIPRNKASDSAVEDTDFELLQNSVNIHTDELLKGLTEKLIEHNYKVSDPLAREAFASMLLQELYKLISAHRKEACEFNVQEEFNSNKFQRELEYIKEISDWLKNTPFYSMLTTVKEQVEFVNGLAKNIGNIEEERNKNPGKIDYEVMLHVDIFEYMKQLPIKEQDIHNLATCVNQLRERIAKHRSYTPCLSVNSQSSTSIKINEKEPDSLEFLHIHSNDTGDDQVAREAYRARLKESKRIVLEKADTDILTDSQVHDKFVDVPDYKKKQQPYVVFIQSDDNSMKRYNSSDRDKSTTDTCSHCRKHERPGDLIVEVIESWCKSLPICEKDEDSTNAAKDKVATNLFQKVGLLNVDPRVAHDDHLYEDMLADEVETELQNLSNHSEICNNKEHFKSSLIDKVMVTKKVIKEMSAGENYKQALENTIDSSFPNPVQKANKNEPGYELYKKRMTMLWLLENYDYATDFNSLKYKKKLNEEIENYSIEAQKRNVFPIDKHEVFNEIFRSLYKQIPPKVSAIIDEVQNIKMRCEIDAWFNELPLKKATRFQELLERDQILAVLAKRLYDIEKSKYCDGSEKMHRETMKWLKKFQFCPNEEKNIPKYSDALIRNLNVTENIRQCKRGIQSDKVSEIKDETKVNKSKEAFKTTRKENTNQIAGPSRIKTCCKDSSARKKAGDLITTAVETWCKQLPITAQNSTDKEIDQIKDEAIVKMYQILNDLHADPNIINSEGLYQHRLNDEIEKMLSEIPGCCELQQTRNARKAQIIKELLTIRPLIKNVLDREEYKQELKHVITRFFVEITRPNNIVVNDIAKDSVVDEFIGYSFHKDDFDDKQIYKSKINEVIAALLLNNQNETRIDPLLTSNQLICEMSKVKPPKQSVLMDEVEEIELKNLVGKLLNEIEIPKDNEEKRIHRDQMKLVLAKRLTDISKAGQNCANSQKMKAEITRVFKKLGAEVNPDQVDAFVNYLNMNENAKHVPFLKEDSTSIYSRPERSRSSGPLVIRSPQQSFHNAASSNLQSLLPSPQPSALAQPPNTVSLEPSTKRSSTPESTNVHLQSSVNRTALSSRCDIASSGPKAPCMQFDNERSAVTDGLPNAYLDVQTEEVVTMTKIKIQGSPQDPNMQTWSSLGNNQRNTGTAIETDNLIDCKCKPNKRRRNCKGPCKAFILDFCDK